jgi:integrase
MGVRDDGKPDRRHVEAKTETEVTEKVRKLESARDAGKARKAGPVWTVEKWLRHWVENISAPTVRDTTADSYRNAVYKHLIPGVGAHRLDRIQPEHFEKLYQKMIAAGHKPANAHQVHRTARTAFNEALRRGHITQNAVSLAKPPRIEHQEIVPYEVEEVQRILTAAANRRNAARWAIALVLGLRQGEVLGLKWSDIDLEAGTLRVRENRLRPKYRHGCGDTPCGRKAGFCPQKVNTRKPTGDVKSLAGRRPMGVPVPLVAMLEAQRAAQAQEREQAGDLWQEDGYVFTTLTGRPINPNTDFHEWKDLLKEAGVRDGRLHDARHTAATLLLILEVVDRTTQGLMGWSDPSMPARYQHLVKRVQTDVARRQEALIWQQPRAALPPAKRRQVRRKVRRARRSDER